MLELGFNLHQGFSGVGMRGKGILTPLSCLELRSRVRYCYGPVVHFAHNEQDRTLEVHRTRAVVRTVARKFSNGVFAFMRGSFAFVREA